MKLSSECNCGYMTHHGIFISGVEHNLQFKLMMKIPSFYANAFSFLAKGLRRSSLASPLELIIMMFEIMKHI